MYNNKRFLAIIPARGGSKRIPKKNILELCGKPLITYSIEAGLGSKYIDEVIVSSDNEDILRISKDSGARVIDRPTYLANDKASTFDTVKHVIDNIESYDYIVLLQPTSPLRRAVDIDNAIELLIKKEADAVVSVSPMEHSPLWANRLEDSLSLEKFIDEDILNKRSQDLDTYYRLNGAIYICKIDKLLEKKSFFIDKNIYAYIMERKLSIDIDEFIDFQIAELLMNELNNEQL